jgi:multiple sugar transport system permease protein
MAPLVYLQEQKKFTVAIGLRVLQGDYFGEFPVQYIMSMTFVSLIPVILAFFVAQRFFIQGIVITGVKG